MLPTVLPMLATASSPFDASHYSFEVKWDGVRMLAWKIAQAWRCCSVRYVLFDLLYYRGRCLIHESLSLRRTVLAEACSKLEAAEVVFSAGVVGAGTAFFAAAVAQGHEGIVAKLQTSRYRPGRRSPAWLKIKPGQQKRG